MCNLYRLEPRDWQNKWAAEAHSRINLRDSYENYPDLEAPIIRNNGEVRELAHVRWGLPTPTDRLEEAVNKKIEALKKKGKPYDKAQMMAEQRDPGTTNIRHPHYHHWSRWMGVENRCIVPVTAFAEPDKVNGGNAWFAMDEDEPLFWFAGVWIPQWKSVRKVKNGPETIDLFAFLTTKPNRVVGEYHDKAMPVILKNDLEIDLWLTKPWSDVKHMQRPLPDDELVVLPAAA
jgi:putative SOS response-associated peptidase YedK